MNTCRWTSYTLTTLVSEICMQISVVFSTWKIKSTCFWVVRFFSSNPFKPFRALEQYVLNILLYCSVLKMLYRAWFQSAFHDGKQPNWFHQACFFKKHRPQSEALIDGFPKLRIEDQKEIKEEIGKFDILWANLFVTRLAWVFYVTDLTIFDVQFECFKLI